MGLILSSLCILVAGFSVGAGKAEASGGAVKMIDYYDILLGHVLGFDEHMVHTWLPTAGALLTLLVIIVVGVRFKAAMEKPGAVAPDAGFSVRSFVEMLLDLVHNLAKDIIGTQYGMRYFPLLAGLFIFIFFSNLSGLIPGFVPATDNINTNLAMGLVVFLAYNYAGIKEHGAAYIKQFAGPVLFLIPLMLVIEIVGHLARPISLSLRLYGNIFGDHLVLSVFTGLVPWLLPMPLLFFGLLVASLQSFIFTLLTSIYISMAVSHDH